MTRGDIVMYKGNPLVIYTGKNCIFCKNAMAFLEERAIPFEEKLLETLEEREALVERAHGRTSVPQIFWGDRHIGGYDDLCAWIKAEQSS